MEPKTFDVGQSMKPTTPTIISVNRSDENFEVLWDTNMEGIAKKSLYAEVTYYKASDMKKEQAHVEQTQQIMVSGYCYYKILGQHLEPSTSYVVSVRSITHWSGIKSDSSNEYHFKTLESSSDSLLLAIIIGLSIAAVLLCGAIYVCLDKLKSKWWDTAAKCPNPKLDIIHSSKQEVLRPIPAIISSISVNPIISDDSSQWSKMSLLGSSGGSLQHSSGISTGSSNLSYANAEPVNIIASCQNALCKIFPNISPVSQEHTPTEGNNSRALISPPSGGPTTEMVYGSSGLMNKTYSILIPHQSEETSPEVHMQTEMLCQSPYRPKDDIHQQRAPPFPTFQEFFSPSGVSSFVETDMSYQTCNQDFGTLSEDSSSSCFFSGANTTMSSDLESGDGTGCGIVGEAVGDAAELNGMNEGAVIADTACSSSAEPQSGLSVDDDYQPFQSLVGQLDVSLPDPTCLQPKEHLDQQKEELLAKILPNHVGFSINHAQSSQSPVISCLPADWRIPAIVDGDYHAV